MSTFEESFCAAEESAFRFLTLDHGFHVASRQVGRGSSESGVFGRVVYQADPSPPDRGRSVSLDIAPLRRELTLSISMESSGTYTLEELHALDGSGAFPPRQHALYDAMHNPDELVDEFARLAATLRAAGARFFEDDSSLWSDLRRQRARHAEAEAIRQMLASARRSFRERDWTRVIALLGPLELRLGKTATARLAYARRRSRSDIPPADD